MVSLTERFVPDKFIVIPAGREINHGYFEDGEIGEIFDHPITARVIGEVKNGALPVRIILDGKEIDQDFLYHQPVPHKP